MAGDIREIDMTKATSLDGKKVRLVGDDGKGYWMEKDTFISVVGELIGTAGYTNDGLMKKDIAPIEWDMPSYTATPTNATEIGIKKGAVFLLTIGTGGTLACIFIVSCQSNSSIGSVKVKSLWKGDSGNDIKVYLKENKLYIHRKYGGENCSIYPLICGPIQSYNYKVDLPSGTTEAIYE